MKRCILVLLVLLAPACASQAVELQAGWYAQFEYVMLEGHDLSSGAAYGTTWQPMSQLGQFGDLKVDIGSRPTSGGRTVTITSSMDTQIGVLFEDAGAFLSGTAPYFQEVHIAWTTNYDSGKIQLQMYRRRQGQQDELIWRQTDSGFTYGYGSVWDSTPVLPTDSVVFKLVTVPEPSCLVTVGFGVLAMTCFARRRVSK